MLKQMSPCDEPNLLKTVREEAGLPLRRSSSAIDGLGFELQQELFLVLQPEFRPIPTPPPDQKKAHCPKIQQPWWIGS